MREKHTITRCPPGIAAGAEFQQFQFYLPHRNARIDESAPDYEDDPAELGCFVDSVGIVPNPRTKAETLEGKLPEYDSPAKEAPTD